MNEDSTSNASAERPVGKLFTDVYRERGEVRLDSDRFRIQLHQAFRDATTRDHGHQFAKFLREHLGIDPPSGQGTMGIYYRWDDFFAKCPIDDLLNVITIIYKFGRATRERNMTDVWLNRIQHALVAQNMAYEVDEAGGMHLKVDIAFHRSAELTLECLAAARFDDASKAVAAAFDFLTHIQPDTKLAVINIFMAAETVFKLIANTGTSLTFGSVDKDLRSVVQARYREGDQAGNQASNAMCSAIADWVNACQPYRHGQKTPDHVAPPMDLAIALVSSGADFIRWMVSLSSSA